ncbi:hypothetical protein EVJ58_g9669 [Rhodofomes roseus]|uniref:SUZ domain-containing protein n=1 Tax=Rhodofomes roseus TaxID=34475 RepID=A0A4Y9XV59_9APHY|nr:hypothetical protein EVJ58_g9669 [Rhodofomes roseus]
MSVASTSTASDVWEQSLPDASSLAHRVKAKAPVAVVRDSWDDDDDEDKEEEDPQALWENANKKAPMPELVMVGSGTSTVLPPPPAAFQPTLKILKRPTAGASSSAPAAQSAVDAQKSYAEREAQYQAARQRIFSDSPRQGGADGLSIDAERGATVKSRSPPPADTTSVRVLRAPRGPPVDPSASSATNAKPSRGFAGKRGGRGAPRG